MSLEQLRKRMPLGPASERGACGTDEVGAAEPEASRDAKPAVATHVSPERLLPAGHGCCVAAEARVEYVKQTFEAGGLPFVAEVGFAYFGADEDERGEPRKRALVTGLNFSPAITDPFRDLGDFLIENASERRPAITEPINAVAQLFQDIAAPLDNSRFGDLVGHALRFLSLTAVRPVEVNNSEWTEIDWDSGRWTISALRSRRCASSKRCT